MKWLLITWYIAGGYPWTSYEFDSEETCKAAQKVMIDHDTWAHDYRWFCVKK